MKPCDPWREELANCALGLPASRALAEHLTKCSACSTALRKLQARVRDLDDGMRRLTAAEPSPNSAASILAQIGSRVPQRPWLSHPRTIAAAFAALVILAVSAFTASRFRERRQETEKALSAAADISKWRSPTQDLLRPPYDSLRGGSPRLGEYFYELKPDTLNRERYTPRAKEKENP
jgi:hypothetical protein